MNSVILIHYLFFPLFKLGVAKGKVIHTLTKSKALTEAAANCGGWAQIVVGQHHTLALDASGNVHALGRVEYGRLGLGDQRQTDATEPIKVRNSLSNLYFLHGLGSIRCVCLRIPIYEGGSCARDFR